MPPNWTTEAMLLAVKKSTFVARARTTGSLIDT
jgi:hypothetical protein